MPKKERNAVDLGLKPTADPVFFISMVSVDLRGYADVHEHIFDLYTKGYDFLGTNFQVISAQDLWTFYESKNKGVNRRDVNIYVLVEFFVKHHSNGHFIIDECPFLGHGDQFNAISVDKLREFVKNCRKQLKSESNLFWIAFQSNILADLSQVKKDFGEALTEMKEELKKEEWTFPTLQANMRNQVNIANVNVEQGSLAREMQSSIEKLKSGSSLTGEVPLSFKVYFRDWKTKKDEVLKHCFELMNQKSEKNVVVLWDDDSYFKDVANDIRRMIKDKKVVSYPSTKSGQEGISNVKNFVEKNDHILVTEGRYFSGCEAANIIFLTYCLAGMRNFTLRGVQNIICVQITGTGEAKISGMKEDKRFL